jgi:hypothetical protein
MKARMKRTAHLVTGILLIAGLFPFGLTESA